jgi:excisionase family DNA binding protein
MTSTERPTLSVAETADLLGISRWLVQQAVRDGSLPSMRVGRRILIPKVQLDALLAGTAGAPSVAQESGIGVVRLAASQ